MGNEVILVVDDNLEIADLIARRLLPSMGFDTLVAHDGRRAMEIIRKTQLSLILLDLQLPDTTGLDLLRLMNREGYSIPTIITTGEGSEHIAVEAFRLGVQDYLPKPVDPVDLKTSITRALTQSRLIQEKARLTTQLQEQVSWLTILSKVGRSVTSTLEVDEVLRRIVEAGVLLTQAEEGFLALLEDGTGQLYLRAVKNLDQDRVHSMHLPVNDTLVGRVVSTGRPFRSTHTIEEALLKVSTGYLVQSLLHVPILSKGKVLGVLSVDNQTNRRNFSKTDEALLTSLSDYAAVALENARLFEQARDEIEERKRVAQALRDSEERYALAVQGANDGLWDWDLRTNTIYYSPRWKTMLGYTEEEITDQPNEWFSRVHPEDLEQVKLDLSVHFKGLTLHFENEHRMLHKDGTYRHILSRGVAVKENDDTVYRMAGSQTDITDRKNAEEKLLHDAFYDSLTNLPNRALFLDRLRYSVERAKRREDYLFAVLFLDLDRFKDINDTLGHMVGDQLLISIADMLRKGLRSTDTVARLGGDEFVILLEDITNASDATRIANWIHKQLSLSFRLNDHKVFITTSIGIVLSETRYDRTDDVLRDADIAMYSAKANGRARHEIFDPTMRTRILERMALETELRQAVERQEFCVFYQPIVSLETGSLTGFEALIRWNHPTRGLLSPAIFLPILEETGMIIQVDRWVLRRACTDLYEWQQQVAGAEDLTISVNLSGKQMMQPDLVEKIQQVLDETSLPPRCLKLEMTETIIMENSDTTVEVFNHLQALGVQLQIDDFGVGYSSLNYLSHFPVNALKIDRSFVSRMLEDTNQLKIVQAIVMLTNQLKVNVIAEGVETSRQLIQLKELGCEFGQGYLMAAPMDVEKARALVISSLGEPHAPFPWSQTWIHEVKTISKAS